MRDFSTVQSRSLATPADSRIFDLLTLCLGIPHDVVVTSLPRRVYRKLMHWERTAMDVLPARIAARIDRALPFVVRPMNGQRERQKITRGIAASTTFDNVIETGTYRGGTTRFLADTFNVPTRSVEAVPRYHCYARGRLAGDERIELFLEDSRGFIQSQSDKAETVSKTVFFYLDAHWEDDLPLGDELRIIANAWERAVVMVDDFEVPGDPGYGFDHYGPGKALAENYLPEAVSHWTRLYPVATSDRESGARRGCIVLLSPALEDLSIAGLQRSAVS